MSDDGEPQATPETQPFWDGCAAGELRLQRCQQCRRFCFYPRVACPSCGSAELRWQRVSGRATLYSYVISHLPGPAHRDGEPYVIAVVELDEGPRMMSNIVGVDPVPAALPLDLPLDVDFEPRGSMTVPVFRPRESIA